MSSLRELIILLTAVSCGIQLVTGSRLHGWVPSKHLIKQAEGNLEQAISQQAHEAHQNHQKKLHEFIAAVPKAELHIHVEGTLEPGMMLAIAARNGLPAPYPSEEAARAAYQFDNLQSFLDLYYKGCSVLRTTQDFYDLAWAYLRKASANNISHVELFFDPQTHLDNDIPFSTFFPGLLQATQDAREALDVDAHLVMCFLKHLSEESAWQTLDQALPYLDHIIAVGLDSTEIGNPPSRFKEVMAHVTKLGKHVVAHAGEEGPASYIWDALLNLKASRIDHGVHATDDPELMAYLEQNKIPLTVCPLSNLKLKVFAGQLPERLRDLILSPYSLVATINSDDPAYFGGYLNANYAWLSGVLELNISQAADLARNSFRASFISQAEKDVYLRRIDDVEAQYLESSA